MSGRQAAIANRKIQERQRVLDALGEDGGWMSLYELHRATGLHAWPIARALDSLWDEGALVDRWGPTRRFYALTEDAKAVFMQG